MGVASRSTPSGGVPRRPWAHARTTLGDALRSPELHGGANRRVMTLAHQVRLAIGLVALAATPVLPDLEPHRRLLLATLAAFVYLPYAFAIGRLSRASSRPGVRLAAMVGDAGIVFLFSVLVPDIRVVALFGYLLLVAFHTFLGGAVLGIATALCVASLAGASELIAKSRAVDGYTLLMFLVVLVILAVIIETATQERRRTARFLARLQHAISQVPAAPDLGDTLQAVAGAARQAVTAKFVSVLVRDSAGVAQGALEGDIGHDRPERSSEMIAEILREPGTSPSGIVLTTGRRVVVPVIADDPRFTRWIPETQRQGFTSTIAVPLHTGDSVIGVLAAYFPTPELVEEETVELLAAYADHASLVILRALAFEHERRAAARLAEADAIKTELVSTVSHELRTPLTAVKGFVETVLRHWDRFDDEERQALLERSLRNADQLSTLVDQVLDYSRLEAGAVITVSQPLDLEHEVRRIIEERTLLLSEHPVRLDLAPGATADGDRDGLERVLDNLLANAAKYSPPGTPITVATAVGAKEVVVSVQDEGPGIPPEDVERVFDRFYRVAAGQGPRGTGIGLAIVKRYVELMGGRVWVRSVFGHGSTFSVALPVSRAPADVSSTSPPAAR